MLAYLGIFIITVAAAFLVVYLFRWVSDSHGQVAQANDQASRKGRPQRKLQEGFAGTGKIVSKAGSRNGRATSKSYSRHANNNGAIVKPWGW